MGKLFEYLLECIGQRECILDCESHARRPLRLRGDDQKASRFIILVPEKRSTRTLGSSEAEFGNGSTGTEVAQSFPNHIQIADREMHIDVRAIELHRPL